MCWINRFLLCFTGDYKKMVELYKKLSTEISKLSSRVEVLSEELDSLKMEVMSERIETSKNYELAVNQFQYLNGQIGRKYKKLHELRYLLLDLLSDRCADFELRLKNILEQLQMDNEEALEEIYNFKREIEDFLRRQMPIIMQITKLNFAEGYSEQLIYPMTGDIYNPQLHEEKLEEGGTRIKHVYQLGYNFPNYFKKALVTLNA